MPAPDFPSDLRCGDEAAASLLALQCRNMPVWPASGDSVLAPARLPHPTQSRQWSDVLTLAQAETQHSYYANRGSALLKNVGLDR